MIQFEVRNLSGRLVVSGTCRHCAQQLHTGQANIRAASEQGYLLLGRYRVYRTGETREPTLCWDCRRALGGCSWADRFCPVDGWAAEETLLYVNDRHRKDPVPSYRVIRCPEFERG